MEEPHGAERESGMVRAPSVASRNRVPDVGAPRRSGPALHAIYRSWSGENRKGRPDFYSKEIALASFLRAWEAVPDPKELIFLNDGPVPSHLSQVMRASGEVVTLRGVGNRRSLRRALATPIERDWPASDLVWFAEDDYLYRASALVDLVTAASHWPSADYFALYASIGTRPPFGGAQPAYAPVPSTWRDSDPVEVNGHHWRRALSHAATFGVRVSAIRRQRRIFELSLYTATAWDHTACLCYQGVSVCSWRHVVSELMPNAPRSLRRRATLLAAAPFRVALNAWAFRQRRTPSTLVAADPALATHMETDFLALGTDWSRVAADVVQESA